MTDFIELPIGGRLLNLETVRDIKTKHPHRINYVLGGGEVLHPEDAEVVIAAMRPKPRGRKPKAAKAPGVPEVPTLPTEKQPNN